MTDSIQVQTIRASSTARRYKDIQPSQHCAPTELTHEMKFGNLKRKQICMHEENSECCAAKNINRYPNVNSNDNYKPSELNLQEGAS
jgi:hypothetical protein